MCLCLWYNARMRFNFHHLNVADREKIWLSYSKRISRNHFYSSLGFQHSVALALIDPEGKFQAILSHGTVKNDRIKIAGAANNTLTRILV